MSNLKIFPFPIEKMKLTKVFNNDQELAKFTNTPIECQKTVSIYGSNVSFPEPPADRPYNFAMFVMSMDGKIAYENSVHGPYIAALNVLDLDGGDADFWMLSLTRSVSDAILKGANTLMREPLHTAHIFDQPLVDARIAKGLSAVPRHFLISLNGQDIPFEHRIFNEAEVPVGIVTSPTGAEYIKANGGDKNKYVYFEFDSMDSVTKDCINEQSFKHDEVPVIVAGKDTSLNNTIIMKALRYAGIKYFTIESPIYTHVLLQEHMIDEMWLNYSMVYVGAKGRGMGENMDGFTPKDHPHAKILTLHMHSPSSIYVIKWNLGLLLQTCK